MITLKRYQKLLGFSVLIFGEKITSALSTAKQYIYALRNKLNKTK